jgi:hypothetical protein
MPAPKISSYSALMELQSAPINPAWILEGTPAARNRLIAPSTDRFGWTMLWDCTAGRFNWHYTIDETVHIIDGSVTITDADGKTFTLTPGDIAFFPAGCSAHWHVESYVRKVAYCQKPVPSFFGFPLRALRKLVAPLRKIFSFIRLDPAPDAAPEFQPRPVLKKATKST